MEKDVSQEQDETGFYDYIYHLWLKRRIFAVITFTIAALVYLQVYTENEYEINAVIKTNLVSLHYNNMKVLIYAVHPEFIRQLIKLKILEDEENKNMPSNTLKMKKLFEDTDIQAEFIKEADLIKVFFITRNADQGIELLQWILARLEIKADQEKSRNVEIKTYASLLSKEREMFINEVNQLKNNPISNNNKSLIQQKINYLESQIIIKESQIKQIEDVNKIKAFDFLQNPKKKLLRQPNHLKMAGLSILIGLSFAIIIVFLLNGIKVFYTGYIKPNKSTSGNNRQ